MSGAKFILPGENSQYLVLLQQKGPTTNHGLGKTDVPRSE